MTNSLLHSPNDPLSKIQGILSNTERAYLTSPYIKERGETYSVLAGDTTITRHRKVTEWGFHGGISVQESLVPFLDMTLNL
jgi:hypothetical protein